MNSPRRCPRPRFLLARPPSCNRPLQPLPANPDEELKAARAQLQRQRRPARQIPAAHGHRARHHVPALGEPMPSDLGRHLLRRHHRNQSEARARRNSPRSSWRALFATAWKPSARAITLWRFRSAKRRSARPKTSTAISSASVCAGRCKASPTAPRICWRTPSIPPPGARSLTPDRSSTTPPAR